MKEVMIEPKEIDVDFHITLLALSTVVGHTMGWIYRLAPGYTPRKADKIVDTIVQRFRDHEYYESTPLEVIQVVSNELDEILDYLYDFKEFKELNLSQKEFKDGIKVDDPNRLSYLVLNKSMEYSEEDDFIDLDALKRNIKNSIQNEWDSDKY